MLSDGYVSGIVAHLSKEELAKYDAAQKAHPELGQVDAPESQPRRGSLGEWPKHR